MRADRTTRGVCVFWMPFFPTKEQGKNILVLSLCIHTYYTRVYTRVYMYIRIRVCYNFTLHLFI